MAAGDVHALWLATQQAIVSRVALEYKNTLNGVALNLEVVRSRLARAAAGGPEARGPAVDAFAETASGEFERLSVQSLALLGLMRPVGDPADVKTIASQLAVIFALAAGRDGGRLTVDGTDDGGTRTTSSGATVRLVVAQAMLAALEDGVAHELRCTVCTTAAPGDEGPRLTMTRIGSGGVFALPDDVARVAVEAGIRIEAGGDSSLILTFPPARGEDDRTQDQHSP
jgi:hypothetical protein